MVVLLKLCDTSGGEQSRAEQSRRFESTSVVCSERLRQTTLNRSSSSLSTRSSVLEEEEEEEE